MKSRKKPTKAKPRKPYIWTVVISDGYCTYEYKLEDRKGNKCIQDLYEAVRFILGAKPSKGRFVWPSE
jgi:hypothetical protein